MTQSLTGRLLRLLSGPIAMASSASLAIRLMAIAVGFLQAVLAARLLGPTHYGVFALVQAISLIAATAALLGLGLLSVRELAQLRAKGAWGRLAGFLRFSRTTVLAVSGVAGILLAGAALALPAATSGHAAVVALGGALLPMVSLLLLYRDQARGLGAVVVSQMPVSLLRLTLMAIILGLLYLAAVSIDAFDAVLIYIAVNAVAMLSAAVIVRRAEPPPAGQPTELARRQWLSQASPFLLTSLVAVLQGEASTVMLGWLAGPTEAGLYQPVARIVPIMGMAMEALSMPMGPRLAQLWITGEATQLQRIMRMATLAATATTLAVAAAILLLAPWILGTFGDAFRASQPALYWIAAAQVLHAAAGQNGLLLSMGMRHGITVRCQLAGVGTNLLLGLVLIPPHGAVGAAMALAAGIVVTDLAALVAARVHFGFNAALPGALGMLARRTAP